MVDLTALRMCVSALGGYVYYVQDRNVGWVYVKTCSSRVLECWPDIGHYLGDCRIAQRTLDRPTPEE